MPAFDAQSTASASSGTSLTWNHTTSGADRFLCMGAEQGAGSNFTAHTYNGISMTRIGTVGLGNRQFFSLIAPALGTNSVSVAFDANAAMVAMAASYTGVDQTTAYDGLQSSDVATADVSVVVASAVDNLVVGMVLSAHTSSGRVLTDDAGQTPRATLVFDIWDGVISDKPGGASVEIGWLADGTSGFGKHTLGFNLRAASSGGTTLNLRGTSRGAGRLVGAQAASAIALATAASRASARALGATLGGTVTLATQPVRAGARLLGASLPTALALSPGAVRGASRIPGGIVSSAVPLRGLARGASRMTGAELTMLTILALRGVSRSSARAEGSALEHALALRGLSRDVGRLAGATVLSTVGLTTGAVRAIERSTGCTVGSVIVLEASAVRAVARLLGLTLTDIADAALPGKHPLRILFLGHDKTIAVLPHLKGIDFLGHGKTIDFES